MSKFVVETQAHQMAPSADHVFEIVRRNQTGCIRQATFIIGQIGSRHVDEKEAKSIVNGMALGANLRDLSRPHKTVCGYEVRNLTISITANEVFYVGDFFGAEQFWNRRKWGVDGRDYGEKSPTEMDLLYAD